MAKNTYVYLLPGGFLSIEDHFIFDAKLLCKKYSSINMRHMNMLRQFKMSDSTYMLSEDLLMVISRIFQIEFEDLWNTVYMENGHTLRSCETNDEHQHLKTIRSI